MSPVMRTLRAAAAITFVLVVAAGCSKGRSGNPFDPEAGHPDDWYVAHRAAFVSNSGPCIECHGDDLLGGISKVSCFSAAFDGQACHPGGPRGGHPPGWAAASSHGPGAKAAGGFSLCEVCHGADFSGGTARVACFGCHRVRAPHPRAPWRGTTLTHTSTDPSNAGVCAQCHRNRNPGTPGCFNNTLCHAQPAGHPEGWQAPGQHGSAAMGAPGTMRGFASCEVCHGGNFAGGTGPSCFPCHGWNAPHARTGWLGGASSHRSTDQANAPVCAQCHRSGAGTPGCFNNTLCHGAGGAHPAGWSSPSQHGAGALVSPGFPSCTGCHGGNFAGGTGPSCFPCHGWNAPHGKSGWQGGGSRHRTAAQWAGICAQCHRSSSGTAGCFNNTLCHGAGD